jgi:hypothetical protein
MREVLVVLTVEVGVAVLRSRLVPTQVTMEEMVEIILAIG